MDVLENLICLCRKHHQAHEHGRIADITLQLILYHFYGYGPDPGTILTLEAIKNMAQDDFGLPLRVESPDGKVVTFSMRGTTRWAMIPMTIGFLENVPTQMAVDIIRDKLHGRFDGT